jgi:hypothetical protein
VLTLHKLLKLRLCKLLLSLWLWTLLALLLLKPLPLLHKPPLLLPARLLQTLPPPLLLPKQKSMRLKLSWQLTLPASP